MNNSNYRKFASLMLTIAIIFLSIFGNMLANCTDSQGKLSEECTQHYKNVANACCEDDCCSHECKCFYSFPATENIPLLLVHKFVVSFAFVISSSTDISLPNEVAALLVDETELKDQFHLNSCKNRAPPA